MVPDDRRLEIGSLVFDGMDQIDLTGPFEVLSRIPNAGYRLYGAQGREVRDMKGLRLLADADLAEASALDVLHVPGGHGQEALMEDEAVLGGYVDRRRARQRCFRYARARCCWVRLAC